MITTIVAMTIAACSSITGNCDNSIQPKTWLGPTASAECHAFIESMAFDPSDYLVAKPEQDIYMVSCD